MKKKMKLNKQSDMNVGKVIKDVKFQEVIENEERKKEVALKVKQSTESLGSESSEHPALERVNADKK